MRKNVAGQIVAFQMLSATDGSAITSGTATVYVTIDGNTQSTGGGTSTHEGNGQWTYAPTQDETNGNHVAFTMAISGAVSACVNVYPVAFDPSDSMRLGLTALPNAAADAAGGLPISDAGGLDLDAQIGTNINDIIAALTNGSLVLHADYNAAKTAAQASVCTEVRLAELDAANLPADVAAIPTNPLLATANGSTFTAIPNMALATTQATIATYIDTEVAAILAALTDGSLVLHSDYDAAKKLNDTLENDGGTYRFTANALEQAPSGGGGGGQNITTETTIIGVDC